MADHSHSSQPALQGMDAHRATYEGFLNYSAGGAIVCFYILVALMTFRFMSFPLNLFVGFGGLIVGIIVTLIGLKLGGKWLMPMIVLVLYGLFVAANLNLAS